MTATRSQLIGMAQRIGRILRLILEAHADANPNKWRSLEAIRAWMRVWQARGTVQHGWVHELRENQNRVTIKLWLAGEGAVGLLEEAAASASGASSDDALDALKTSTSTATPSTSTSTTTATTTPSSDADEDDGDDGRPPDAPRPQPSAEAVEAERVAREEANADANAAIAAKGGAERPRSPPPYATAW